MSVADRTVGALYGALSKLRQARSFHPDGIVFEATVEIDRPSAELAGAPLLATAGAHPAIVRLSRGLGLPEPLPDVLGLTVRFVNVHGPGRHQDFLMVESLDGAPGHHVILPVRSFFDRPYSSILLYRIGSEIRLVGALQVTDPEPGATAFAELERTAGERAVAFDLAVASLRGRWQAIGRIRLGERLALSEGERIRFNPWNTGGGIRPTGPLMGVRDAAYRGSQRGWRANGPS